MLTSLVEMTSLSDRGHLPTLMCLLQQGNPTKPPILCRLLLDSGSQGSWICQKTAELAKLPVVERRTETISGIGGTVSEIDLQTVNCTLMSTQKKRIKLSITCKTIPNICGKLEPCPIKNTDIPKSIRSCLTEKYPRQKLTTVHILIGQDFLFDVLKHGPEKHKLKDYKLLLWHTIFGLAVSGNYVATSQQLITTVSPQDNGIAFVSTEELNATLKKFWASEDFVPDKPREHTLSPAQKKAEEHFLATVKFNGRRYQVSMPFDPDKPKPESNYKVAMNQFLQIEKALQNPRNELKKKKYIEAMNEYFINHYAELSSDQTPRQGYFLPAHGVFKHNDDSSDAKMRIVFNASSPDKNGVSLNSCLLDGVPLQPELFDILTNFRMSPVCLIADIQAMFLQVEIEREQRKYLKFLWRPFDGSPLKVYQMKVVTFGVTNSPWLVQRVLRYHIDNNAKRYPKAVDLIRRAFYVDDYVGSLATVEDAIATHKELTNCLISAGFRLTKCLSNSPAVMLAVPEADRAKQAALLLQKDPSVPQDQTPSTLGLSYDHIDDTFKFINIFNIVTPHRKKETMRTLCSRVASIFDVLGLLGCTTIQGKILIQACWQKEMSWDEPLEFHPDVAAQYEKWVSQLVNLHHIEIPRFVLPVHCVKKRLVAFTDASDKAYGACLYMVATSADGQTESSLLCTKSRVAPLKTQTIPRLELRALELGAIVMEKVSKLLQILDLTIFTDSSTALCWLQKPPNNWRSFVMNRVANIQALSTFDKDMFRFVPGKENVADALSRGVFPEDLVMMYEWFHGPPWLTLPEAFWPPRKELTPTKAVSDEQRIVKEFVLVETLNQTLFAKLFQNSNYLEGATRLAFILRFIRNCRRAPSSRIKSAWPSRSEMLEARKLWLRFLQEQHFPRTLAALSKNRPVRPNEGENRIFNLQPQLNEDGLLVAGGRLATCITLPNEVRRPIILPQKSAYVQSYVLYVHRGYGHPGPEQTLAMLRSNFWIVNTRREVRRILQKCSCYRLRAKHFNQLMAPLPDYRLDASVPQAFLFSALDMFGPIEVRNNPPPKDLPKEKPQGMRKKKRMASAQAKRNLKSLARQQEEEEQDQPFKVWGLIFCCLKTRGVHIEYVRSMDTMHFINALKRFIARRGYVKFLYMDNALNFHKAEAELKRLYQSLDWKRIEKFFIEIPQPIQFEYVTPLASWKAGVHEIMVKLIKTALRGILKARKNVTLEEFRTVLIEAEAVVNSRPLTMQSTGSLEDPLPLTPFHLIAGRSMQTIPDFYGKDGPDPLVAQWNSRTKMMREFWDRWFKEYCLSLHPRAKWTTPGREPKVGEVVLVRGESKNRYHWPLARIIDVDKGIDGLTRTVTLRTFEKNKRHVKMRGVQHIFRLEGDVDQLGKDAHASGQHKDDDDDQKEAVKSTHDQEAKKEKSRRARSARKSSQRDRSSSRQSRRSSSSSELNELIEQLEEDEEESVNVPQLCL